MITYAGGNVLEGPDGASFFIYLTVLCSPGKIGYLYPELGAFPGSPGSNGPPPSTIL